MTADAHQPAARRLRDALEPWCAAGSTGALRALDPPGGAVYLSRGRISYAESPPACGVDRLLTASGRLTNEQWRAAVTAGRAGRRVGETLVHQGLLARTELEAVVLAAIHGAALFLFDQDTEVRFEMGAGHIVGSVVDVDLPSVCAEVDRRRRVLTDAWPDSKLDNHAVVPAKRLAGQHVALTALQWEIVANADRRRTPVELAWFLGRDTFAMLWEVRRLARAGLVEPGRAGTASKRPEQRGQQPQPAVELSEPAGPAHQPRDSDPASADPPATDQGPADPPATGPGPAAPTGAPLPRRDTNGSGWRAPTLDRGDRDLACSESNLVRIRDGLDALR